jgi:hypothetical protein
MNRQHHRGWVITFLILILTAVSGCADYPSGPPAPSTAADTYTTAEDTPLTVPAAQGILTNDNPREGNVLKLLTTGERQTENGGRVNLAGDGSFVYTPPADFNGVDSLVYTVQNDTGKTSTGVLSVTVTPVNDDPVAVTDTLTMDEDGTGTIDVLANDFDADAEDVLTARLLAAPLMGAVKALANGSFSYTPAANFNGDDKFSYRLSDGNGAEVVGWVMVTVRPEPDSPIAKGDTLDMLEDSPGATLSVLANDRDPDGGQLTVVQVSSPANGTAAINPDGTVTYQPAADFSGIDTFIYTIKDPDANVSSATVTVTVAPINDRPSFAAANPPPVNEDATPQTLSGWATFDPGSVFESGQTATYLVENISNPGLFTTSPAVAADGTLSYAPAPNANGTASFDLSVTDNGGTANGGVDTSDPQTFTITVRAVNDQPSFTVAQAPGAIEEDGGNQSLAGWASFNPGATNEASQTATYLISAISNPALFGAPPAVAADGRLTYRPADNAFGTSTFTVTVRDNGGTANGGVDTSDPQTFSITVNAVNDAPTISAIANQSTPINSPTGPIPFTIGDAETAAASLTLVGESSNIGLVPNTSIVFGGSGADRTVTLTPAANQVGTTTITLAVSDGDLSASRTFTLSVQNTPPTISDIPNQTILENTALGPVAFTVGDSETPAGSLTVSGTSSNTTLAPDASIVFGGSGPSRTVAITPAAGQSGSTTITVTVSDGLLSGADTFLLTVTRVNQAPQITSDPVTSVSQDQSYSYTLTATDPDGDNISLSAPVLPAWLNFNANTGVLSGTPTNANVGVHGVTLRAGDGLLTADQTFTVTVINLAPILDDSPAPFLTPIDADVPDGSNGGDRVDEILSNGNISDGPGEVFAIAVTAVDNTNGIWQFSTDDGASWVPFSSIIGQDTQARLLDAGHRIRFVPDATYRPADTSQESISFRAWDETSGTAGQLGNVSAVGGTTAFSEFEAEATISVNPAAQ